MDEQGCSDAAILLMSLGEEEAAEVFRHLSPKEVQKLGETIAKTRAVSKERVDEVLGKFTGAAAAQSLLVSDTGNYVRAVLKRALGDDKATLLIDRILQGGDVSGIESLKWMDPISVAELLARNGTIGSPPVGGHRRRKRRNAVSVHRARRGIAAYNRSTAVK